MSATGPKTSRSNSRRDGRTRTLRARPSASRLTDAYASSPAPSAFQGRDLRSLLHVPQHDLQAQLASRLERLGFPALRPALVQLLSVNGSGAAGIAGGDAGVRLSDLVSEG